MWPLLVSSIGVAQKKVLPVNYTEINFITQTRRELRFRHIAIVFHSKSRGGISVQSQ